MRLREEILNEVNIARELTTKLTRLCELLLTEQDEPVCPECGSRLDSSARKIDFNVYTTPDGRPTCRLSPEEQCPFLFCYRFGYSYLCGATQSKLKCYGKNVCDYIEPNTKCFIRLRDKNTK